MHSKKEQDELLREAASVLIEYYILEFNAGRTTTLRGVAASCTASALLNHATSTRRKLDVMRVSHLVDTGGTELPPGLHSTLLEALDNRFANIEQRMVWTIKRLDTASCVKMLTERAGTLKSLERWMLLAILAEYHSDPLVRMARALELDRKE